MSEVPSEEQKHFTTIEMQKCSLCKEWVPRIDIRQHTIDHFDIETTQHHICDSCGKSFKSGQELSNHARTHGEKQFHCTYKNDDDEDCGRSYFSKQALEKHIDALHTKTGHKVCDICAKTFKTGRTLQSHMKKDHGIENRFQCKNCFTYFLSEHRFRTHDSTKCKPFKCEMCGKICKSQAQLDIHVGSHGHREKIYGCDVCDTRFTLEQSKKEHMKKFHSNGGMAHLKRSPKKQKLEPRDFICHCGKGFSSEPELIKHRAEHFEQMGFPHSAFVGHQNF